ncbi:MAG: DDE transposase [Betaproteobacteria bacterium]|nr:MAG: DDE transposase [Betaproteobacteria bacterium]
MRGPDAMQEALFTVAKLDDFVPSDHPLRAIRVLVNQALAEMNAQFNEIYAPSGRDSIAPEKLIRALLLQVFYSIRSERQLCEQLRYNLLFRWFVGLAIDDPIWDHSTFSKNRDRLLEHQVVEGFFAEVLRLADRQGLLSKEHFSVDGTLIQAWASQKSFRPKDGSDDQTPSGGGRNAQADWKGRPRSNDTHESTTDPDARLFRKSHNTAATLCYQGHALMENRHGLVVGAVVTHADGTGERRAAVAMLEAMPATSGRRSVGADKAYDTVDFVAACRQRNVAPHVACNDTRNGGSAIDGRTTRHASYRLSQVVRKRIEEHFGWGKTIGRIRQTVFRGLRRVDQQFKLTLTASNLMRLARMAFAVPAGVSR